MGDRSSAGEKDVLWRVAQALNAAARPLRLLPPLLFFTDPERTPDPVAVAARLPRGAGIVFRGFGRPDAEAMARDLAMMANEAKLNLLIGQDADLAERCGAQGVHLPERALAVGPTLRARHPAWILTGAAHGAAALASAREAGLDAAILSPVFASRSPSAGAALGVEGFSALVASADLPVYALGGITAETAPRLEGSGAVGLAAIEGVLQAFSTK
jgi:thiamine-phosphate pyrophosphorylase